MFQEENFRYSRENRMLKSEQEMYLELKSTILKIWPISAIN